MSDRMRWRWGGGDCVVAAVSAETVIEIGDLLWQDMDNAKPASDFDPSKFSNPVQEQFADKFLGVAMQRSCDGDTSSVRVATTGVFEFDCLGRTFELGDMIGVETHSPEEPASMLQNQRVEKTSCSRYAIGRVAKREASATTSVLVDIRSKVMGPL